MAAQFFHFQPYWGLDMRRGMEPAWDLHGQYSTDIFTKEAMRIIKTHNASKSLFLYLAHAAVHSGNPYNPLPAPDEVVSKFGRITDYNRRRFAGNDVTAFLIVTQFISLDWSFCLSMHCTQEANIW